MSAPWISDAYYIDMQPVQQVDDRSVWCNLLPKASSPGTHAANRLCELAAELFTADELARDLSANWNGNRVDSPPHFTLIAGGSGPDPQPPIWLNPKGPSVTGHMLTIQASLGPYQPSTTELSARLARAEKEKRDLQTRIALARQVQRVESEVRSLRNEFSALCREIGPVVSYFNVKLDY